MSSSSSSPPPPRQILNPLGRSVGAVVLVDWAYLKVAALQVAMAVGPLVVAVVVEEVAPLVAVVKGPEVEVLALQGLVCFHKGTATKVCYRTPVDSQLGANRTPVVFRHAQQA